MNSAEVIGIRVESRLDYNIEGHVGEGNLGYPTLLACECGDENMLLFM